MATEVALRDRVRRESGNPPTNEISEADIDAYLAEGLIFLDRFIPGWVIKSLTTQANVQTYSIDSSCYDVAFIDYRGDAVVSDIFGLDFNVLTPADMYDVEVDGYRKVIDALSKQQVRNSYAAEFNPLDKKIYLIPCPTQAGWKVWYIGLKAWTIENLPARFEQWVIRYATTEAMLQKARRGRRESAIAHTGGIFPWTMSDPTLGDARKLRDELETELIRESSKYVPFWSHWV
jgi:hypothetical protein